MLSSQTVLLIRFTAATFAVAVIRQSIYDRDTLPDLIFEDAVFELATDDFFAAWTLQEEDPFIGAWGSGSGWGSSSGWGSGSWEPVVINPAAARQSVRIHRYYLK